MCDNVSTKLPYFGRNFKASIIHAVWAMLNLLQESGAGGALLMFSDFFVHKPLWSYGQLDTATKILLQAGKASREIGKK